ncbi:uncharacterized protein [Rutidosis leptorrhynchoides]|uniref:uncharacterized protein n=1 Tax=Rutidosis leptorrhynchoides TaxID=125765 RepID=UPI003A9949E9
MRSSMNSVGLKYFFGNGFIRLYVPNSSKFYGSKSTRYLSSSYANSSVSFRFYSSEGNSTTTENIKGANQHDAHVRGEQDNKVLLIHNEKLGIESKKKESPFLTKRQRLKNEFIRRIIPWEEQTVSWDTFPGYVDEHSKDLLVECAASHLKHKKCATTYGPRLDYSSGRILLRSKPGTEIYRERFARALARDLKVPLLILDSTVLAPCDFGEDESADEDGESDEDISSESESDYESSDDSSDESSDEEDRTSSNENKSEDKNIDDRATADATKNIAVVGEITSEPKPFKKGDRIIYIGATVPVEGDNRPLDMSQRGEIYEINGENVGIILHSVQDGKENMKDEQYANPSILWINRNFFISKNVVKDIKHDFDVEAEDGYIAKNALSEVLQSVQPLIVYFPDLSLWLSRAVSEPNRKEFMIRLQFMLEQISGPVLLICGQNKAKAKARSRDEEQLSWILQVLGRHAKLPPSVKQFIEGLKPSSKSEEKNIYKIFTNIISLDPPKEEDQLKLFNKQISEDKQLVTSRSNINQLHKVVGENGLSCVDLLNVNTDGVTLTTKKAKRIVGWAKSHYLSTCDVPSIMSDRLNLPRESLEVAIKRLLKKESVPKKPAENKLENLAEDEYEENFIAAVVPPGEIGIKFDDIGALEDVKTALHELAILPMKRPELFSRGNLLRPCKGILLFGPPGTGKTLLAKALANEAGAHFISVTSASLTSMWYGEDEKYVKGLFSFASKLAPVIIFVDEVDSLLGARGGHEHEATRRMRNEFMSAWDGLRSKDNQRILVLGATNRPFDLDDAVIRRMPRRIYVDLPDTENRLKILEVLLAKENIEPDFDVRSLANATEGYSGSDLKNLCIAAAYRPVQELLDEEKKGQKHDTTPTLRLLNLDDFIQSKAKVSPSVCYDATSMNELREWNEEYGEGGSRRKSPFGF